MMATGILLMTISACVLHWGHKRQMREVAAMGIVSGAVLVLVGLVGAI